MFRIILTNREFPIVIFPMRGAEINISDAPDDSPHSHVLQLVQGSEGQEEVYQLFCGTLDECVAVLKYRFWHDPVVEIAENGTPRSEVER